MQRRGVRIKRSKHKSRRPEIASEYQRNNCRDNETMQ